MKFNKKIIALTLLVALLLVGCGQGAPNNAAPENGNAAVEETQNTEEVALAELPKPSDTEGDYTADASNINKDNLVDYLNRADTAYIDLRDYEDYSKKHFKNFEVIPYFGFIFNENAGTEGNPQLYKGTVEEPEAVYDVSEAILNTMFPKDKNLMIMCQSGGRVEMLMKILAANGYDMSKVYNIGGLAQYTSEDYREYITDSEELTVEAIYKVEAQPIAQ